MVSLIQGGVMRTTVTLDDELMKTAQEYTGVTERGALIQLAMKTLVELEAGRRLALLEGTMPDFPDIPRRRSELPKRQQHSKKAS
jgi:Arc/MetJ family transcription regulator